MNDEAPATSSWPLSALQAPPNSITTDNGLTNQALASIASDLGDQNDDIVAALDAIAAAINAKPSA